MKPRSFRDPSGPARPSRVLLGVLAVMTAFYMVDLILHDPPRLIAHLALIPRRALGPEPWQLVTTAFLHVHFGALLSTVIAFWFFGAPLEAQLGRARVYQMLIVSTIVGSLASAGLGRAVAPNAVITGAFPASMALIAGFGIAWGNLPIALFGVSRMKASTCAAIFLGISAVMYLMNGDYIALAGGCAGAGVGALFASSSLDNAFTAPGRWAQSFKKWRIRRRYRVIPGGRDSRSFLN